MSKLTPSWDKIWQAYTRHEIPYAKVKRINLGLAGDILSKYSRYVESRYVEKLI
jgi:hypothetical protein